MRTKFNVTVLGSSAAVVAHGRSQSALIVSYGNRNYLVDCGEGTQVLLEKHKISTEKLEAIFISHLHADHYLGLFGLISTMGLRGRQKPLKIIAPIGLREIISIQLKYSNTFLPYDLVIEELNEEKEVFQNEYLSIKSFRLEHRVPTYGYKFIEKLGDKKLKMENVPSYFSVEQLKALKRGEDVESNGTIFLSEELTYPLPEPRSFAYCSDTRYFPELIDSVKGVDLLYHEATFLDEMKDRAERTHHTTAKQAGQIAKKAKVGQLIISHFSARYPNVKPLLNETKQVFDNALLAEEGLVVEID